MKINKFKMMPYREWVTDFNVGSENISINTNKKINYKQSTIFAIGKTIDLFNNFKYKDFFINEKLDNKLSLKRFNFINKIMITNFMLIMSSMIFSIIYYHYNQNSLTTFLILLPALILINLSTYIKIKYKKGYKND